MASIAEANGARGKVAKPPISTHPAFPFIVALWFAALLGMGSLVVPVELIGQIAVSTGLASVVPATAPPLGFTARALIALTFTGAGAVAGLVIARQIAKAHSAEPTRNLNQHRPIDAHAELGAHGLDGNRPAIQPKGRRSLAIELDHGPSELMDFAPLPGKRADAGHSTLEMLDLDAREFIPFTWETDGDDEEDDELELTEADLVPGNPFDRALAAAPAADLDRAFELATKTPEAVPGFQTFADDSGDAMMHDMMGERPPFGMPMGSGRTAAPSAPRQMFRAAPAPVFTPTWSDEADADEVAEDVAEFAPEPDFTPEAAEEAAEEAVGEPLNFSPPSLARFDAPQEVADAALFTAPSANDAAAAEGLEDMGLVQLAQRLGNSIERRRERMAALAQQSVVAAALPPLGDDIDVAAPDEAAQAMAAYFARPALADEAAAPFETAEPAEAPAAVRQMFQPVAYEAPAIPTVAYGDLTGLAQIGFADEDEDDDAEIGELAASFSLPLGQQAVAPPSIAAPALTPEPAEADLADEPDFASLLALRNPFHAARAEAFVRIEDEPEIVDEIGQTAVVFPVEMAAVAPAPAPTVVPVAFAQPASAPVNTEENERALREALLSLQRMSGTA